jgi:hypothetical protein
MTTHLRHTVADILGTLGLMTVITAVALGISRLFF